MKEDNGIFIRDLDPEENTPALAIGDECSRNALVDFMREVGRHGGPEAAEAANACAAMVIAYGRTEDAETAFLAGVHYSRALALMRAKRARTGAKFEGGVEGRKARAKRPRTERPNDLRDKVRTAHSDWLEEADGDEPLSEFFRWLGDEGDTYGIECDEDRVWTFGDATVACGVTCRQARKWLK